MCRNAGRRRRVAGHGRTGRARDATCPLTCAVLVLPVEAGSALPPVGTSSVAGSFSYLGVAPKYAYTARCAEPMARARAGRMTACCQAGATNGVPKVLKRISVLFWRLLGTHAQMGARCHDAEHGAR